jgi:hypothetical protein
MANLVVCLDGTWNNADSPAPQTNIARIAGTVDPKPLGGARQRVYYDRGVGTAGFFDCITGGLLGVGLSDNILEAYRFLCQHYQPGDSIFIFGYSRGAFTARSLCGFIAASGLLRADACNKRNQRFAWRNYRTPPKKRYPADQVRLAKLAHANVRVRFLGAFDTVGALGIPRKYLNWFGRSCFQFHDTEVSSVVDHTCHALAIDEQRMEFEAAVWSEPRHREYASIEQVWFPGAHADVGGGNEDRALCDLSLDWMLGRLRKHCPELGLRPVALTPDYRGTIHDPRTWLYWRSRWRPLVRLINRCEIGQGLRCRLSTFRPHSRPIGEMVHWSALVRWNETKDEGERYAPANLLAALDSVQEGRTLVVGTDGEPRKLSSFSSWRGDSAPASSYLM